MHFYLFGAGLCLGRTFRSFLFLGFMYIVLHRDIIVEPGIENAFAGIRVEDEHSQQLVRPHRHHEGHYGPSCHLPYENLGLLQVECEFQILKTVIFIEVLLRHLAAHDVLQLGCVYARGLTEVQDLLLQLVALVDGDVVLKGLSRFEMQIATLDVVQDDDSRALVFL